MARRENMDPELIPVRERYGYCQGPLCAKPDTAQWVIQKKPVFILAGQRLCRDCCRKVQRHAEGS